MTEQAPRQSGLQEERPHEYPDPLFLQSAPIEEKETNFSSRTPEETVAIQEITSRLNRDHGTNYSVEEILSLLSYNYASGYLGVETELFRGDKLQRLLKNENFLADLQKRAEIRARYISARAYSAEFEGTGIPLSYITPMLHKFPVGQPIDRDVWLNLKLNFLREEFRTTRFQSEAVAQAIRTTWHEQLQRKKQAQAVETGKQPETAETESETPPADLLYQYQISDGKYIPVPEDGEYQATRTGSIYSNSLQKNVTCTVNPDYDRGVLRFEFAYTYTYTPIGDDRPDDFGDAGSWIGWQPGRTIQGEPIKVVIPLSTMETKIRPEHMPLLFGHPSVAKRCSSSMVRDPLLIVRYQKEGDAEPKRISVARWDPDRQLWSDESLPVNWRDPKDTPGEIDETQKRMAAMQELNIVEERDPPVTNSLPQPHLPNDDVPIAEHRRAAAEAKKQQRELELKRQRDEQLREQLEREKEKRAAEERKQADIEETIGPEAFQKVSALLEIELEHAHFLPRRLADMLNNWKRAANALDDPDRGPEALTKITSQLQGVNIDTLRQYLKDVTVRNYGITARVIVKGGKLHLLDRYGAVEENNIIPVGNSGRTLRPSSWGGQTITLRPDGKWGSEVILDPGSHVIGRDGYFEYKVRFDTDIAVRDVLGSSNYPELLPLFPAGELDEDGIYYTPPGIEDDPKPAGVTREAASVEQTAPAQPETEATPFDGDITVREFTGEYARQDTLWLARLPHEQQEAELDKVGPEILIQIRNQIRTAIPAHPELADSLNQLRVRLSVRLFRENPSEDFSQLPPELQTVFSRMLFYKISHYPGKTYPSPEEIQNLAKQVLTDEHFRAEQETFKNRASNNETIDLLLETTPDSSYTRLGIPQAKIEEVKARIRNRLQALDLTLSDVVPDVLDEMIFEESENL